MLHRVQPVFRRCFSTIVTTGNCEKDILFSEEYCSTDTFFLSSYDDASSREYDTDIHLRSSRQLKSEWKTQQFRRVFKK